MRTTRTLIIAIAAVAVAAAALATIGAIALLGAAPRQRVANDAERFRATLGARIEAAGTAAAYAELKKDAAGDSIAVRHGKAHVFGELAYAKDGEDGIKVCDSDFTFGCFHGFIVRALGAEGLAALPRVDAACAAAYGSGDTGCRHGIGHGLVDYFGPRDLADALEGCASLRPPGLLGCTQGAFMEYANAAADDPSLADGSRPDMPCAGVAEKFRPSCYFEQPYFWSLRLGLPDAAIAARCAALADAAERRACLLGYGRSIAELDGYRDDAVAAACGPLAPANGRACYAGAHWLYAALGKTEPSPSFCDASGDREGCLRDAAAIE